MECKFDSSIYAWKIYFFIFVPPDQQEKAPKKGHADSPQNFGLIFFLSRGPSSNKPDDQVISTTLRGNPRSRMLRPRRGGISRSRSKWSRCPNELCKGAAQFGPIQDKGFRRAIQWVDHERLMLSLIWKWSFGIYDELGVYLHRDFPLSLLMHE